MNLKEAYEFECTQTAQIRWRADVGEGGGLGLLRKVQSHLRGAPRRVRIRRAQRPCVHDLWQHVLHPAFRRGDGRGRVKRLQRSLGALCTGNRNRRACSGSPKSYDRRLGLHDRDLTRPLFALKGLAGRHGSCPLTVRVHYRTGETWWKREIYLSNHQ